MFKKIVKRDGKIVDFNLDKITDAIAKAGAVTEEFKHDRAAQLSEKVLKLAEETVKERTPTVEQIQDLVEKVLMDSSFKRTAKAYITYDRIAIKPVMQNQTLCVSTKQLPSPMLLKTQMLSVATPTLTATPLWVKCYNLAPKVQKSSPKPSL